MGVHLGYWKSQFWVSLDVVMNCPGATLSAQTPPQKGKRGLVTIDAFLGPDHEIEITTQNADQ